MDLARCCSWLLCGVSIRLTLVTSYHQFEHPQPEDRARLRDRGPLPCPGSVGPPSTLPPAPLPGCRDQLGLQDAIWVPMGAGVKADGVSPHPSKPPGGPAAAPGMNSNNPGQRNPHQPGGELRGAAWPGQVGEQTSLYSVKYLFLHYFTRVVFTKKNLQKFPKKHRHAKKKKIKKSTVGLVTSN